MRVLDVLRRTREKIAQKTKILIKKQKIREMAVIPKGLSFWSRAGACWCEGDWRGQGELGVTKGDDRSAAEPEDALPFRELTQVDDIHDCLAIEIFLG